MAKRPSFQFYPSDWRTDVGLRLCSGPARGLWIEMLCMMHEGEPYGHLTLGGEAISDTRLARLHGEPEAEVTRWREELRVNNVYSITSGGVIFSRRMIRDEQLRELRASSGQKGAEHGKKGGRPPKPKTPKSKDGGND
ncbi:hypothetical protein [Sphingobium aromaticiconvertens]|uniref:hypothetical protein n=1 Tax=Sphingobium aromaticiconvertens TaxID=365341 RepID=UPI003017982D